MKSCDGSTHQDPLDEHVVILLGELRSAQYKLAQQLHSRLSHTGGVVHQATMNATLHIRLQDRQESVSTKITYEATFHQTDGKLKMARLSLNPFP